MRLQKQVIVLAGLPLTGKTTLGNELARQTNLAFLDVDKARQVLAPGKKWLGPEKEREIMIAAYRLNHQRAKAVLKKGRAVIVAATYSRPIYHQMVGRLSSETSAPVRVFLLDLPRAAVAARIKKRTAGNSDSNIQTLEGYLGVEDRYQEFPGAAVLDASLPIGELAKLVLGVCAEEAAATPARSTR